VGAHFEGKVTFHDGCHGLRELGVKSAPRELLANVRGLELVEMGETETCCGFGGTFAVAEPDISAKMGRDRLRDYRGHDAQAVVSTDMSCLMHLGGLARRERIGLPMYHVAEVLAGTAGST
jgi:L-lactate dehydrogenase complex protein LldE